MTTQVLIVEDEPNARAAMSVYLARFGYEVTEAGSAEEALAAAAGGYRPDAVICDWRLPGGQSGIEVARMLKARDARLTAVIVTAHSIEECRRAAADLDVLCFLSKPAKLKQLQHVLSSVG